MPLIMRPGLAGARFGRPGLLGLAARTAVVAGTAGAVSGAVQRRQEERAEADAYEQQAAAAPVAQAPAPEGGGAPADHRIEQLKQLAQLRAQGVLTDAELEQQKAKILDA
jgi:hypothetical protein